MSFDHKTMKVTFKRPREKGYYWNNQGKLQEEYDRLFIQYIPAVGKVHKQSVSPSLYDALEVFRIASKLYYRYYNDGDKLGEQSDFESYYKKVCYFFPDYCEYMTTKRQFVEQSSSERERISLSWIVSKDAMEDWMNAIIQYVLANEPNQSVHRPKKLKQEVNRHVEGLEKIWKKQIKT